MSFDNIYLDIALANFNFLWILLYVIVIRQGFREKTFGVPMVALWFNLSFDVIDSFFYPAYPMQIAINLIYIVMDLVILYQIVRFWRSDFGHLPAWQFFTGLILSAVFSFALLYALIRDMNDVPELRTAYVDVLINSVLFLNMYYRRPHLKGQSMYVALAKLLGTGPLMLAFTIFPYPGYENSLLLPVLYLGIFIADLLYAILVYTRSRELGINPWRLEAFAKSPAA